jgi:hypothetical protein
VRIPGRTYLTLGTLLNQSVDGAEKRLFGGGRGRDGSQRWSPHFGGASLVAGLDSGCPLDAAEERGGLVGALAGLDRLCPLDMAEERRPRGCAGWP